VRVICGLRCWLVGKTVDGMDAQAPSAIFSGTLVDVCRDLSAGPRTPSGEVLRIEDACQQLSKKSSASAPTLVTQGICPHATTAADRSQSDYIPVAKATSENRVHISRTLTR
jgi:hypothetical protein